MNMFEKAKSKTKILYKLNYWCSEICTNIIYIGIQKIYYKFDLVYLFFQIGPVSQSVYNFLNFVLKYFPKRN